MPKTKRIVQFSLNAVIFIAMEIAALNMLQNNGAMQNFFLSKGAHKVMAALWGGSESVRYYFSLKKANEELASQNFTLSQKLRHYEAAQEILHADSLSGRFRETAGFSYMPASIVKISRNKQHNYIIIGQGSEDGVKPQSGIITEKGVIGIVEAVGRNYSYAISFMNTELNISARLGKEGAVGPLQWDGKHSGGAILREIPLQYRFEPGDTVYTSGYSSIFPPDIPLGITGGSRIVNGATYEIEVSLLQDFNSAKYITLVTNTGSGEIERLERQQGGE